VTVFVPSADVSAGTGSVRGFSVASPSSPELLSPHVSIPVTAAVFAWVTVAEAAPAGLLRVAAPVVIPAARRDTRNARTARMSSWLVDLTRPFGKGR
jgi:hypothetical protein